MNKKQSTFGFIEKIITRMQYRQNLLPCAKSLLSASSADGTGYMVENEQTYICQPNIPVTFVCSSGYAPENHDCIKQQVVTTFNCNTTPQMYQGCGTSATYACNANSNPSFSCTARDAFDCHTYNCAGNANNQAHICDSKFDFVCGGENFSCKVDFKCQAAHVFGCDNNASCDVKFTCAGGTNCTSPGSGNNSCTPPMPPYGAKQCAPLTAYSQEGNFDPGDFMCAFPGALPDAFDCSKKFDCISVSEFSCRRSGDFRCSEQGGANDGFECSGKTFACLEGSQFSCTSNDKFKCEKVGTTAFVCIPEASYALCKSKDEKECQSWFDCGKTNNCKSATAFQCKAQNPTFTCFKEYTVCQNDNSKDCEKKFGCPSSYICVTKFGCKQTSPFNCTSNFNCDSPSPYTTPPPSA